MESWNEEVRDLIHPKTTNQQLKHVQPCCLAFLRAGFPTIWQASISCEHKKCKPRHNNEKLDAAFFIALSV